MKWLKEKIKNWLEIYGVGSPISILVSKIRILENDVFLLKRENVRLQKLCHNLVSIGIDVHFSKPHMILIYSRLKGGQIREISANFQTIKELNEFVAMLRKKFKTDYVIGDKPISHQHLFDF